MNSNQDSIPEEDTDTVAEDNGGNRSPMGLLGLAFLGARALAGRSREVVTELARSGAQRVEARALSTLKRKLDGVPDADAAGAMMPSRSTSAAPSRSNDPALLLGKLLQISMDQSEEEARRQLYFAVLRQLLPDEARLLSALADGSVHAMCHVGAGPMVGAATHRVLENFSGIGRTAALRCQDVAPQYLRHLRELGLIDSGPEDPRLGTKYQLLESDLVLRQALDHIEKVLKLKPRIFRHTIRMSAFGKQLWAACQQGGD